MSDYAVFTPVVRAPAASPFGDPASATLGFENLVFDIKKKRILHGISGTMRPGELCAIMGPSGSGKTTLLNVLAGRMRHVGTTGGNILVNGRAVDPFAFRTQIAYVMQEDALFATQTPREALAFSAALRLPSTLTRAERNQLVESTLGQLGLQKCADTYIGSIMIKGISGGEKKRTAIGIELIAAPRVLFLDEPTSGLDSFAAFKVVQILQELARGSTNVICTIHQPSSEVFDLFDSTLLLAEGRVIYHGAVANMVPYFANLKHVCKPNFNPADFVMFLIQQSSPDQLQGLAEAFEAEAKNQPKPAPASTESTLVSKRSSSKANVCTQLGYLGIRDFQGLVRDWSQLIARFGITIFLNLVVGVVFKDAARWNDDEVYAPEQVRAWLSNHFGALVQVAIGGMFGLAQATLLQFPLERPVFLREHAVGTYSAWPYFASKLAVEIPMAIAQSAVLFLTTYWLIGFQGNFLFLTLATSLVGLTAASTSLLLGSAIANVQVAIQLSPLIFVPQLLFAGFFISITAIPEFMRWVQYLCSLKYGINLLMIAEFSDLPTNYPVGNSSLYYEAVFGCSGSDLDLTTHTCTSEPSPLALFPRTDMSADQQWVYFGILMGVFCFFRITACIVLSLKARR